VFMIGSGMAAISGIVAASRLSSVATNAGAGNTLLYAVGAAVIGGTSLFGGRGKARDAVFGGLVIATIENGLGLLGTKAYLSFLITGVVLLLAASMDALARRRRSNVGRWPPCGNGDPVNTAGDARAGEPMARTIGSPALPDGPPGPAGDFRWNRAADNLAD